MTHVVDETLASRTRAHPGRSRVLHVCGSLLERTQTFVQQRLAGDRFEALAVTWRRVEGGLPVPCPVIQLPERDPLAGGAVHLPVRGRRLARRIDVLDALRRIRPVVVHAHFGEVALEVEAPCRLLGIPLVVSFYGYDVGVAALPSAARAYARLWRGCAAITAEGPVLARRLVQLGAPEEKVKLLPLALPPWALLPPDRVPPADPTPLRLVQVARFVEKKGIDVTLRAVALARREGTPVRLDLIGDGPLRPNLERLVRELSLTDVVRLPGLVAHDELARWFGSADALVQPSRTAADGDSEGGAPAVVLEAQAQGLPVLATFHADIPSVVRDGVTGFLVPENEPAALAGLLRRVSCERVGLARAGVEARRFALRRHDPVRLRTLQERVYGRAIRAGAASRVGWAAVLVRLGPAGWVGH